MLRKLNGLILNVFDFLGGCQRKDTLLIIG